MTEDKSQKGTATLEQSDPTEDRIEINIGIKVQNI